MPAQQTPTIAAEFLASAMLSLLDDFSTESLSCFSGYPNRCSSGLDQTFQCSDIPTVAPLLLEALNRFNKLEAIYLGSPVPIIVSGQAASDRVHVVVQHQSFCSGDQNTTENQWIEKIFMIPDTAVNLGSNIQKRSLDNVDLTRSRIEITLGPAGINMWIVMRNDFSGYQACYLNADGKVNDFASLPSDIRLNGDTVNADHYDCTGFFSYASPGQGVQVNPPVIDSISSVRSDCFTGIRDRCQDNMIGTEDFTCADNEASVEIAQEMLQGVTGITDASNLDAAVVTHKSFCENSTETSWIAEIDLITPDGVHVHIQVTPKAKLSTLLRFGDVNSFGTSSVQYACVYHNGEALEFFFCWGNRCWTNFG